jgi:hypothetical protein
VIPWPVDVVRDVMFARVERLVAYVPEVAGVEELERRVTGDEALVVRRWRLADDALPPGLSGFVPPDARGFVDRQRWVGDRVTFDVEPLVHADAVAFSGVARLAADGGDTLFDVDGAFALRPAARERLPASLQGKGVDALEAAVIATIRQHLARVTRAVDRLLDDET